MNNINELKPCPFCGGSDKYPPYVEDMRIPEVISLVAVVCGNCGAMSASEQTAQQAEERWNFRADNKNPLESNDASG